MCSPAKVLGLPLGLRNPRCPSLGLLHDRDIRRRSLERLPFPTFPGVRVRGVDQPEARASWWAPTDLGGLAALEELGVGGGGPDRAPPPRLSTSPSALLVPLSARGFLVGCFALIGVSLSLGLQQVGKTDDSRSLRAFTPVVPQPAFRGAKVEAVQGASELRSRDEVDALPRRLRGGAWWTAQQASSFLPPATPSQTS